MPTPFINTRNIDIAVNTNGPANAIGAAWDVAVNYNFGIPFANPFPLVFANGGGITPAALTATGDYPATLMQLCMVSGDKGPIFSDGATWRYVPIQGSTVANGSGWTDTFAMGVYNLLLTYLRSLNMIGGVAAIGGAIGTRPAYWPTLVTGEQGWDAMVQDNFDLLFNKPMPLPYYTTAGLPSGTIYSGCICVNTDTKRVMWADPSGTWHNVAMAFQTYGGLPTSGWADPVAQTDFNNLAAVLAAGGTSSGGTSTPSRPVPCQLTSGLQGWDVLMEDNFNLFDLYPWPLFAATAADIPTPLASYDLCLMAATDVERLVLYNQGGYNFIGLQGASVANATGWADATAMAQFNALLAVLRACNAIGP